MAAINRELAKLQESELSDRKLNAAKKQLLGQLAISSDNGEAQCLGMGKSLLAYGMVSSSEVEAVTAAEIRDMACRIFAPGRTSSLIML